MKKIITGLCLATAFCVPLALTAPAMAQIPPAALPPKVTAYGPASLAPLVEKLLPSVVNISSTPKIDMSSGAPNGLPSLPDMPGFPQGSPFENFFEEFLNRHGGQMRQVPATSLGSGFVIDAENGYIVTNAHVIQDADNVRVTLHDDTTMTAEVIGRDEKTDLALLKVTTDHPLDAAKFGDSASLRVGDWIIAIGNPFGLGGTVTTGIISAQQRDINAGPYDDFIQTDASINRGNSGGPMFNMNGEVIGINTAIYSPSGGSVGIGFAIPSNLSRPVIDQLIKYGHTRRGWIGVRIQNVTEDIAESLGMDAHSGALIASVMEDGPAKKAGLKAGDIILEFDGKSINQMRSLPRIVAETDINKSATITYWRDGTKHTATVTVGELEKAEENALMAENNAEEGNVRPSSLPVEALGVSLRGINDDDRNRYAIPDDVSGVIITSIQADSEALSKGLETGDVIVEINQQPTKDAAAASTLVEAAQNAGRNSVLLLVNRSGEVRFVALRLPKDTLKDSSRNGDKDVVPTGGQNSTEPEKKPEDKKGTIKNR